MFLGRRWTYDLVPVVGFCFLVLFSFFFFQAEDGIRDLTVTGVQTCALPILVGPGARFLDRARPLLHLLAQEGGELSRRVALPVEAERRQALGDLGRGEGAEIGRASCRERV